MSRHNYMRKRNWQLYWSSMESQTVLFDSRRCTMVRQDALWWNWMSQAKMRASTSLRQFWLTHADTLHFQIVFAPMWLHRLWLPVTGNRKGLYRPKAGRTHQPGSQRMQSLLLEPAGHPWADLECKSCHRQSLENPKSRLTHRPGSQQMRNNLLEPVGHPSVDLGLQSCHHQSLVCPKSQSTHLPGSQQKPHL